VFFIIKINIIYNNNNKSFLKIFYIKNNKFIKKFKNSRTFFKYFIILNNFKNLKNNYN
jgi:hypothetical protein